MHHLRVFSNFGFMHLCNLIISKVEKYVSSCNFHIAFSPCLATLEIDVRRACGSMCWFVSYVYSSCQQTLLRKKQHKNFCITCIKSLSMFQFSLLLAVSHSNVCWRCHGTLRTISHTWFLPKLLRTRHTHSVRHFSDTYCMRLYACVHVHVSVMSKQPSISPNNDRFHFHLVGKRNCWFDFISQILCMSNLIFGHMQSNMNVSASLTSNYEFSRRLESIMNRAVVVCWFNNELFEYKFIIILLAFVHMRPFSKLI